MMNLFKILLTMMTLVSFRSEHTKKFSGKCVVYKHLKMSFLTLQYYRQIPNKICTLLGNKIVYLPNVVGALAVGAAPTTNSFSIKPEAIAQRQLQDEKRNIYIFGLGANYIRDLTVDNMTTHTAHISTP